jgi:hypothetical protein
VDVVDVLGPGDDQDVVVALEVLGVVLELFTCRRKRGRERERESERARESTPAKGRRDMRSGVGGEGERHDQSSNA